jgi:hypothetical protein
MKDSGIRPHGCFTTVERGQQGSQKIYCDQYDGTSSMLKRVEIKTRREAVPEEKNLYQTEREQFQKMDKNFEKLQEMVNTDNLQLKSPQQRKHEL